MKTYLYFYLGLALIMLASAVLPDAAEAQLPRERVELDEPIPDIFWATSNIGVSTVRNLSAGSLNSSVLHTFGLVNGGIRQFYGLDNGANTRLGLKYGFSDRFSLGIGRMTFDKVVDFRGKYNLLRQTPTDSTPLELAVKLSTGISTLSGMEFSDRLNYFASVMIARKYDAFTLQLSPMLSHFNTVGPGEQNQLFGLGVAAAYELNDRFALSGEYLPVLSERNPDTHDAMSVALNIDTGGHVFQIFFASSQWHNEQYIMARNSHRLWEGDFRFGFNIHRAFGLR